MRNPSQHLAGVSQVLSAKLGGAHSVLIFDDVHWMDSASWKLVEEVRK